MFHTLIGLLMTVITAVVLYLVVRNHYRCPYCARPVKWKDANCPHCGQDMKFLHRTTPSKPPRMITRIKPIEPPVRSRRHRG